MLAWAKSSKLLFCFFSINLIFQRCISSDKFPSQRDKLSNVSYIVWPHSIFHITVKYANNIWERNTTSRKFMQNASSYCVYFIKHSDTCSGGIQWQQSFSEKLWLGTGPNHHLTFTNPSCWALHSWTAMILVFLQHWCYQLGPTHTAISRCSSLKCLQFVAKSCGEVWVWNNLSATICWFRAARRPPRSFPVRGYPIRSVKLKLQLDCGIHGVI